MSFARLARQWRSPNDAYMLQSLLRKISVLRPSTRSGKLSSEIHDIEQIIARAETMTTTSANCSARFAWRRETFPGWVMDPNPVDHDRLTHVVCGPCRHSRLVA